MLRKVYFFKYKHLSVIHNTEFHCYFHIQKNVLFDDVCTRQELVRGLDFNPRTVWAYPVVMSEAAVAKKFLCNRRFRGEAAIMNWDHDDL